MCLIKSKSEQFNLKWTRAPSDGCELSTFWMSKQARSMCTKSLKFKTRSDVPTLLFLQQFIKFSKLMGLQAFSSAFCSGGEWWREKEILLLRYYYSYWFNRPGFNVIVQKMSCLNSAFGTRIDLITSVMNSSTEKLSKI